MLSPFYTFSQRDPFAVMRELSGQFDRALGAPGVRAYPAVNVWEGQDAVAITAELPGVETDDIDISIKDNVLTLSGERKAPDPGEKAVWHRRERGFGKFSRAVRLPIKADPDKVEARFQNGVLQIVLHRHEADKPRRIEVRAA